MMKIAAVFASAGLLALAACGEKPAEEADNAVVEKVVEMDNAAEAMDNAADAVENAGEAMENAAENAM
ncbi:MAG: hypothetical protein R3E04_08130 [Sphingobium sp.]